MKFSVLMSVYYKDNAIFLNAAIESIYISQILKPDQVVIVCDGPLSKKNYDILNYWKNNYPLIFNIHYLPSNIGLANALNFGIPFCKFDYIARMDSDDISHPNRFLTQINFLKNNLNISVLGTSMYEFNNDIKNIVSKRIVPEFNVDIYAKFKYFCPINHPTIIFNKNDIINVGGYTNFYLKEDLYLWLRLIEKGKTFHNLPNLLFYFRLTNNTFSKRGGFKYAISESKLINFRFYLKLINVYETVFLYITIIPIRLSPRFIRFLFYKFIIRKL